MKIAARGGNAEGAELRNGRLGQPSESRGSREHVTRTLDGLSQRAEVLVRVGDPEDALEFAKAARRFVKARRVRGWLEHAGRRVLAERFPISIDFALYDNLGRDRGVLERARQLR